MYVRFGSPDVNINQNRNGSWSCGTDRKSQLWFNSSGCNTFGAEWGVESSSLPSHLISVRAMSTFEDERNKKDSAYSIFDVYVPLVCEPCKKSFEKKTDFKAHLNSHKYDDHTYECRYRSQRNHRSSTMQLTVTKNFSEDETVHQQA